MKEKCLVTAYIISYFAIAFLCGIAIVEYLMQLNNWE